MAADLQRREEKGGSDPVALVGEGRWPTSAAPGATLRRCSSGWPESPAARSRGVNALCRHGDVHGRSRLQGDLGNGVRPEVREERGGGGLRRWRLGREEKGRWLGGGRTKGQRDGEGEARGREEEGRWFGGGRREALLFFKID